MSQLRKNQLHDLTDAGLTKQVIQSQNGRLLNAKSGTKIDYVTTNYLGFDFHPELIKRGLKYQEQWGSLSGWSRLEVDPEIYIDLEKRLSQFLGCKDVVLSHTITITNFSVIPGIVGKGFIFCDKKVHTVVWEACRLARDHGATLGRFEHQDMSDLERQLKETPLEASKLICVDGVYSISSEYAPIDELQRLCVKYNAWLYVDDAHGFGLLGRMPSEDQPYGTDGSGVVNYFGGNYKRTFYVSSFGKSFCNHTAFVTIPDEYPVSLRENCLQYIYSAPMAPSVIGAVDASMDLNEAEGLARREVILKQTNALVSGMRELGLSVENNSGFPIVFWKIGSVEDLINTSKILFEKGVLAGLRAFPVVPETECGLRFGVTAIHSDEMIERTLKIISETVSQVSKTNRAAS